jgi:hypothetical protein
MQLKRIDAEVSEQALVKRINRVLAEQDQRVRRTRGERPLRDLGRYWVQDFRRNFAVATNIDLEALGRELGCLSTGEVVV